MKRKFLAVLSGITLLIFGTLMASSAGAYQTGGPDPEKDLTEVAWAIPNPCTSHSPFDCGPQAFAGFTADPGITYLCGVWYQIDTYTGTPHDLKWMFADGLLTVHNGVVEDHAVVRSWKYLYGGDCSSYYDTAKDVSATSLCHVPADGLATVTTTTTTRITHYLWAYLTGYTPQETAVSTAVKVTTVRDDGCNIPKAPKPHIVHHTVHFTG